MSTDEQLVLQIINTYATEGKSWTTSIQELCELTTLPKEELMQTLKVLESEGFINMGVNKESLQLAITHSGYETALDAPQF